MATTFGFVIRFDWLSDSLCTLRTLSQTVRDSERDSKRNEIHVPLHRRDK